MIAQLWLVLSLLLALTGCSVQSIVDTEQQRVEELRIIDDVNFRVNGWYSDNTMRASREGTVPTAISEIAESGGIGSGSQPSPSPLPPVTITEMVVEKVYVPIELRYFRDGDEIREYLADRPVSMPTEDQDCDDLARIFTLTARRKGLDVYPAYLDAREAAGYGFTKEHMLVMAMTEDNSIYYIEPATNQLWWVSPID